jgi:GTPase KRas
MRDQYIRTGEGFLVVYAITSQSSFDETQQLIDKILRVSDLDYVPMVLIGNKCDLESERQVETQAGEKLAEKYNVAFFETSAKFGINIDEAVGSLTKEVLTFWPSRENIINPARRRKQCIIF